MQVTISYVDIAATLAEIRESLASQYHFDPCGGSSSQPLLQDANDWLMKAGVEFHEINFPLVGKARISALWHFEPYDRVFASRSTDSTLLEARLENKQVYLWAQVPGYPSSATATESFPLDEEDAASLFVEDGNASSIVLFHIFDKFHDDSNASSASLITHIPDLLGLAPLAEMLLILSKGKKYPSEAIAKRLFECLPAAVTRLGPNHIFLFRIHSWLLNYCINAGDFDMAASMAGKLTTVYRMIHDRGQPLLLALHLAQCAKLHCYLDGTENVAQACEEAKETLSIISFSPSHGVIRAAMGDVLRSCA